MTNITQRKRVGRLATALGGAFATLGFLVAVVHGPQPVDASLTSPTSSVQQAAPPASTSPLASSSQNPQTARRSVPSLGSRSNTQSTPRLRTRGS